MHWGHNSVEQPNKAKNIVFTNITGVIDDTLLTYAIYSPAESAGKLEKDNSIS